MMRGWIAAAVAVASAAGCTDDHTCLAGDCPVPCAKLRWECDAPQVSIQRLGDRPGGSGLRNGQGGADALVLDNGIVTAVIAPLDAPEDLATSGGFLVDFGPSGGVDDLTILYQLAGILPDDTPTYTSLEIDDRSPIAVAITLRGTLDGRPDIPVATRWELRACDRGVRVRTELWNGSPDVYALTLADAAHWGKRRVAPFAPAEGQGYTYPELELLELTSLWQPFDYVAAGAPAPGSPGYAVVACSQPEVYGVNDVEITAAGTELEAVRPGETLVYERLLVAGAPVIDGGPATAIDTAIDARRQLFGEPVRAFTGRVTTEGGFPFGGDVRHASIVVSARDGDRVTPLSAVVPRLDGTFAISVPDRPGLGWELWSFGTKVREGDVPASVEPVVIDVDPPATVNLAVDQGGVPRHALVVFEPADDATRAATTGTLHGQFTACAPWLGPPNGGSPACNRVLVDPVGSTVEVPAGHYFVFATIGPQAPLARAEVTLVAGETSDVALVIGELEAPLAPPEFWSADLHVHGRASFDSGIPDYDRVRSFVAAGVEVIAATDHDAVADYADVVVRAGVADAVHVIGGLETTPLLPFLDITGEDVPQVIGHFNFWPLVPVPSEPRAGAPWDERLDAGELFDVMEPLVGGDGLMQLNHPWDEPVFGRALGYLRAIDFDPRVPIPPEDDGSHNGKLMQRPGGRHRNIDWDLIEVLNGAATDEQQKARPLWFSLLSQGFVVPGTGNSDSHGLRDSQLGWSRNWVDLGAEHAARPGGFDVRTFDRAVRDGRLVAGNGVFLSIGVGPAGGPPVRGLGLEPYHPAPGDVVTIEVRAAPWVPVEEVRVVTSRGERVVAAGAQLAHPADPFGTTGVVRWRGELRIDELVDRDDWIVVEAGLPFPPVADLDDDGVPDTGDNNGDGVADLADVEPDEDTGPIRGAPDPTDPADPRWLVTRIVPQAWPSAFANPILVDRDGDGWTAPGLP